MKAGHSQDLTIPNVFLIGLKIQSGSFTHCSKSCEIQQNWLKFSSLNCLIHLKVLVTRSTKCKLNTAIEIHLTAAESNHSKKTFWSLICSNCRFITTSYLKAWGRSHLMAYTWTTGQEDRFSLKHLRYKYIFNHPTRRHVTYHFELRIPFKRV